jgi:hypothetical protein
VERAEEAQDYVNAIRAAALELVDWFDILPTIVQERSRK